MAATVHPTTGAAHTDGEVSLRDLVLLLHRRRLMLLACLFLGGAVGVGLLAVIRPVYVASTLLLIEPDKLGGGDAATAASANEALASAAVDSQVQILASRRLAREAVASLGLGTEPELRGGARAADAGFLARLLPGTAAASARADPEGGDPVARFLDNLSVRREGKSQVIAIAYRSRDPAQAAAVANKLAELYLEAQRARKQEAARRQSGWIGERLAALKADLAGAEQALAAFRKGDAPGDVGARGEELAGLGGQLVAASLDRSAKEAGLARLRQEAERGGDLDGPQPGGSPLLATLGAQLVELLRREAELTAQYGERHPKILAVRAEKKKLEVRLGQERAALLRQLAGEAEQARVKEAMLAARLAELKGQAARREAVAQRARELERDVDARRRLYEERLARATADDRPADAVGADARVISEAVPPGDPSFPDARLVLSLSLTSGLLIGLGALYVAEAGRSGFRSPREVEAGLGLPTLALVPRLEGTGRAAGVPPQDYAVARPRSRYAESLRSLLAGLLRPRPGQPAADAPRVVLVTSSLPREGKSTLVASLARVAAGEGMRVIAIDADLRKPSLHALFGFEPGPGLVEVLRREVTLADAVLKDPQAPLRLLPGSQRLTQPTRLLGPEGLGTLLTALKRSFDLVLVDSAPLAAVADPKLLAGLVDAVLYVVRYGETRAELCRSCLKGLEESGATVAGVALTQVDLADHARRFARDAGRAGARLADYYAD